MLSISDLSYQYDVNGKVLHFPDVYLIKEENLLILGKSGVGKTTLLHLMARLLIPRTGSVTIDDVNLNSLSNRELDRFRGRNIGMVFQSSHAIRSLTVLENLKARLFFAGRAISLKRIDGLLNQLDIEICKNQRVNELSEGQLQRLGIALSVVHEPQLILADEPTSSLDDDNCESVLELLQEHAQLNRANLVVITHDQRVQKVFKNMLVL